ncbi:serine/threonine-protein kinase [Streptomyces umbrinus]|uniref:serine/threonine-protein kinase n=1 Tax=Streptomyces umbrinus TaxID=67370 RepID=UPI0033D8E70F
MSDEGRLIAGRYRLIERIGRGGMGTVWRAEDEVLGREIALKRLHAQQHLSEDELATVYERTRREARSAARITHPNVVVVHDVLDDEGLPCIVMEYVHGTTLGALLKGGGALPPGEAARVGLGMVAALRAAHAAGVLHRDVKPGNVLLGGNGRVVLTDFGIAMATGTSTLTKTGEIIGSIDYIAPERMKGHKPGPTADLWALGATLFQSVEGRPPFRRATAMETAYAIAVDPLAPMKQAGPLEPLIEMLLAKDPDERPSAEETERALRVVASEAPGARTAATAGGVTGGTTGAVWASAAPSRATATVAATGPTTRPTTSAGATLADSGSGSGSVSPAPIGGSGSGSGSGSGDGTGRPGRKRRPLIWSAAAVTLAAAAVAGGLYAMTSDNGGHGGNGGKGSATATSPTASEQPPVPAGFRLVREKALGATFPVPDGWKRVDKASTEQVTYTDPSGLVGLTIGTVNPAGANPESHFTSIEANTKRNYPTYRKLRMQRTTFQGQPAAVWEFTFQGKARAFRAIDFGFGEEGGTEYDIYLSAPEAQWDTHRPVFDTVKSGFRVG